jgi:beta-mannosidase
MHFWSVWHEGRDFDHYRDVRPRFCSEFGFQSYPSMSAIRRFADPADFNIAAPVIESHQKNTGGNARIAETMFRYFRFPVGFENFVYLSQVQQGLAIRTAVTQWRGLKPHCQGTLYWQLNDTWPVCSWASLDHGGNWKLLHHMARHFFAPVTVVAVPEGETLDLRAVNDTRATVSLTVDAFALSMAGNLRALARYTSRVPVDAAVPVGSVPLADLRPDEVLFWRWTGPDGVAGEDCHAPRAWKTYDLQPPRLAMTVSPAGDAAQITLSSEALALFVALEADVPGRFSDNAFALLPGAPRHITFTPEGPCPVPRITLRDLHSATYGAANQTETP